MSEEIKIRYRLSVSVKLIYYRLSLIGFGQILLIGLTDMPSLIRRVVWERGVLAILVFKMYSMQLLGIDF